MVVPVVVASETVTRGGRTELRKLTGARCCKRLLLLLPCYPCLRMMDDLRAERERGDGDDERGWAGWSGGS